MTLNTPTLKKFQIDSMCYKTYVMKSKEQIIKSGILEQFVLGLTTEDENLDVRKYLIQYPELEERISSIHYSMDNIAAHYGIPNKKKDNQVVKQSKVNQFLKALFTLLVFATVIIQYFTLIN